MHFFKIITRFIITSLIIFLVYQTSYSQTGIISGTVVDKTTGEPLPGANVMIAGTNIGAAATLSGEFTMLRVPVGFHTLRISYIGYQRKDNIHIEVIVGEVTRVTVEMEWIGVTLDEVTITAQARGQVDAINQQRASNTITNIVSSDRIQELPDVNAAESIGRLPGIAIQRSGGEANKISIRGLSPSFNTVTVNGVRVPSVDTQDRSVDLSLISSTILDGIVVTKALTPDKDADAVGGTVDLRLRTAPEKLFTDFQFQGAYTALQQSYDNYRISGSGGQRFLNNRIGLILGFNYDTYNRSADQFSGSYELIPNPQRNNVLTPNVTHLNLRENSLQRSRRGGNATIDYRFANGQILSTTFYNFLRNEGYRRENQLSMSDSQHKYAFNQFQGDAAIFTTSLSLEQDLRWFAYDVGAFYTSSFNHHPEDYYWDFMEESAFDGADIDKIRFAAPENIPPVFKNDIDNTYFNYMNVQTRQTNESERSLIANFKVPFRFGLSIDGYVKTGYKYRKLTRDHDVEQIGRGIYYGGAQELRNIIAQELNELGLEVGMFRFPMEIFQDNYSRSNFLNGDFPLGYTLRSDDLRRVTNVARPHFNYEGQASLGNDYDGFEEYNAAYIMTEINFGRYITFMPGVRWESEYTDYWAKFVIGTEDRPLGADGLPTTVGYRDTNTVRQDDHILPMIHLQVKPAEWLNLRLAYTHTLSRPSFRQYAPITYVSRFRDWVNAPNSQLKTATSVNYDASLSIYQNKIGFFTISGFYKEMSDLIWWVSFPLLEDQTILPDLYLPAITGVPRINTHLNNTYLATVRGIEFDWQTSFWYLPSFLKGLVLNLNYTILESETQYPQFRREQVPIVPRPPRPPFNQDVLVDTSRVGRMPDQPSSIANITIGYDYKGFSTRISYLYQSDILRSLATNPENDRFTESYYRFDLSIRQKLPYNIQIIANLNNINNRADRNYQSSIGEYPTFIEYYGLTMDLGIRYTFN